MMLKTKGRRDDDKKGDDESRENGEDNKGGGKKNRSIFLEMSNFEYDFHPCQLFRSENPNYQSL